MLTIRNAAKIVTIAKTHEVLIDAGHFNDDVLTYIFNYGLKQVLNDAGSAGKNADQKRDMALVKLDALYNGELRKAREAGAGKSAVDKMADKLAADMVKAAVGHISGKGEWKATPAQREKARTLAAKNEFDMSDMAGMIEALVDMTASALIKSGKAQEELDKEIAKQAALADAVGDIL